MSLVFNGVETNKVIWNGIETKGILNGNVIWGSDTIPNDMDFIYLANDFNGTNIPNRITNSDMGSYLKNGTITKNGSGRARTNAYIDGGINIVNEDIFERGLCLPSDNKMTVEEQNRIIEVIRGCFLDV